MRIIIFGKQGSGKGTVSKMVSEKYNIPHITSGDLLREMAKEDTELGRKIKEILNQGRFPPNEITIKVTLDKIKEADGFILDGYPRNAEQAEGFKDVKIDVALFLEISDEVAIKRLNTRRVCDKCGELFNIATKKPKQEGICDKCGGNLVQREDDTDEAIKQRLELYENETKPIIERYKEKGILREVNGEGSPEEVFERTVQILDNL